MPEGFCVAAVLDRANHADAFVSSDFDSLDALPDAARVGSSSLRRQAQLRMMRPDLVIEPLRGNVNTRLAKLEAGEYDAIILAAAGLERLGLQQHIRQQFATDQMLPAAAQGVIGIECLTDRADLRSVLAKLEHAQTARTTAAERAVALTLQANCQSPVATFATIADDRLLLTALVALPDGSRSLRDSLEGPSEDAERIGTRLAASLLEQGAGELLEQAAAADG
jgi:hydroxymethylbilane synthase